MEAMDAVHRLLLAAEQGDVMTVQGILEEGVFVDSQDLKGTTALQIACANGYEKLVHLLLQKGSSVNLPNSYGWTPLMHAARYGHSSVVLLLLQYKARPNARNKLGMTPLMASIRSGHLATMRILLNAGADIALHCSSSSEGTLFDCDLTPLAAAALHGHDPLVRHLLEKGVSVNEATASTGLTPLMMAACSGHKQTSQILLEWGADANITNVCNKTALDIATARGKREVKAYLEDKTITRPCFESEKGQADIIEAIKRGDVTSVQGLLKQGGASHSSQTLSDDGSTPLMFAALFGHLEVVKLLVQNGADIDRRDNQHGWTALMQAVYSGHTDVAKYLVEAGADVNIQANNGCVALDLACLRDSTDTEMINILARKTTSVSQFMPSEMETTSAFWNMLNPHTWSSQKSKSKHRNVRVWCEKVAHHLRHMKRFRKSSHPTPPSMSRATEMVQFHDFSASFPGPTSSSSAVEERGKEREVSSASAVRLRLCSFDSPHLQTCSLLQKGSLDAIVPPLLPMPSKQREKQESDFMPGVRIPSSCPGRAPPKALQPIRLRQQLMSKPVRHNLLLTPSCSTDQMKPGESLNNANTSESDSKTQTGEATAIIDQVDTQAEHLKLDETKVMKSLSLLADLKPDDDISAILENLSLQKYQQVFKSEEVDVEVFQHLSHTDLKDLGIMTVESQEKLLQVIRHVKEMFKAADCAFEQT